MTAPALHLLVPGPLEQVTGGYRYDRRMVEGLRRRGWTVAVHPLPGRHPLADGPAVAAAAATLAGLPDGAAVLADGLALPSLAAAMARERRRLRLAALVHHPLWREADLDGTRRAALRRLEGAALACARRVVVPSRATAADLAAMGVAADVVAVVPPGTDPAPAAAGSGGVAPALLAVGMVTPRKGHLTLVAALAALTDLPWHLTLVGSLERDPAHAGAVRDALARAGLAHRVTLRGAVAEADLAAAFAAADLFVQPSHHEGYGMALAEALARALPAVSTAVGAAPELLAGGAGLTVPPGDAGALAAALRAVLGEPDRRRRLAAAARGVASRLPTWDDGVDRFAGALTPVVRG
ncbi:glycosyltransferase [Azospirillum sp. ST 5-10]|uniref:glycosyltransferase n=1 Tax=unclassified Azospirillum TaxID=2630922 RepID=UPI003F49CA5B